MILKLNIIDVFLLILKKFIENALQNISYKQGLKKIISINGI